LIEINSVEILIIALGFTLSSISSLLDIHAYTANDYQTEREMIKQVVSCYVISTFSFL